MKPEMTASPVSTTDVDLPLPIQEANAPAPEHGQSNHLIDFEITGAGNSKSMQPDMERAEPHRVGAAASGVEAAMPETSSSNAIASPPVAAVNTSRFDTLPAKLALV